MGTPEAATKGDHGQEPIEPEQHGTEVPGQTATAQAQCDATPDALRAVYDEICRSHSAITKFRGKLLGLLPLATGVGIFLLLDNKTANAKPALLAAAGVFGVFVTIGLFFYEIRGVEECQLLRERGAELEGKLLIPVGCSRFRGYMPGFVGPLGAGPIVYLAVVAGWLFVIVYAFTRSKTGWQIGIASVIFVAYLVAQCIVFFIAKSRLRKAAHDADLTLAILVAGMIASDALKAFGEQAGRAAWTGLSRLAQRVRVQFQGDQDAMRALEEAQAQPTEDRARDLADHLLRHIQTDLEFRAEVEAMIDGMKSDPRYGGKVLRILEEAKVGTVVVISPSENRAES
jgi:hypothetical protein